MMRVARQSAALLSASAVSLVLATGCARTEAVESIPAGTEVTVVTQDGTLVRGKIAKVDAELLTLTGERPNTLTEVARRSITEVKRVDVSRRADTEPPREVPAAAERTAPPADAPARAERAVRTEAVVRTVTVPDNTVLDVTLGTALASDTSRIEQRVTGTVASPFELDGITVIPAGSRLTGHVTNVDDSDKVKGRAELSFRFTTLTVDDTTYDIDTKPLYYAAQSTKKDDAVKIGVGAAAGAIVGAITGGKKGAAIGTAVGAGAGTGVVLATDGKEIRLAEGRKLKVSLTNPLTIRTK